MGQVLGNVLFFLVRLHCGCRSKLFLWSRFDWSLWTFPIYFDRFLSLLLIWSILLIFTSLLCFITACVHIGKARLTFGPVVKIFLGAIYDFSFFRCLYLRLRSDFYIDTRCVEFLWQECYPWICKVPTSNTIFPTWDGAHTCNFLIHLHDFHL